jgi:hypothetical protein
MQRRVTAWLAILAIFASAVLPAHAVVPAPGTDDLCSSMPQKSSPFPAHAHHATCDACCGCGGGPAAPARAALAALLVAAVHVASASPIPARRAAPAAVLARGPPAVTSSPT